MKKLIVNSVLFLFAIGTCSALNAADDSKSAMAIEAEKILPALDRALNDDEYVDAARCMILYKVRTTLDVACSTDASTQAAHDALIFRQMANPKFSQIGTRVAFDQFNQLAVEVEAQVRKDLDGNRLPAPTWVEQYGMGKFMRAFGIANTGPSFKPETEWASIRRAKLDEFKATLELSKKNKL
jgi:hypothetical protein